MLFWVKTYSIKKIIKDDYIRPVQDFTWIIKKTEEEEV